MATSKPIPGQLQLGAFLVHLVVDTLKEQRVPWSVLPEADQQHRIDDIAAKLDIAVRDGMRRALAGGHPSVPVRLKRAVIEEDAIKVTILLPAAEQHALTDYIGKDVVLVLTDPGAHTESIGSVRADSDQKPLPLGGDPDDEDDDDADE